MEAAVMAASAAAAAAKEAALAASVAAAASVKDATTAREAVAAASASALYAKEAAAAAATAGEAAAAAVTAVAEAMRASKKRKFHMVDNDQDPPGSVGLGGTLISSAASLTPSSAASSRFSPPRKVSALRLSLAGGARSGTPLPSISWRTVNSEARAARHFSLLIPKILSGYPGPARHFSLFVYYEKIEGWLNSQALNDLQELELTYNLWNVDLLPSSVFRFAPTLCVAKFSGCRFPDLIVQLSLKFLRLKQLTLDGVTILEDALHSLLSHCAALESFELDDNHGIGRICISSQALKFPCLKQLTLCGVTISEDAVQSIFSGCPALESLVLKENFGIGRLCISSQTLKSLGFCAGRRWREARVLLQELVIEDAPSLERLLPLDPESGLATIRVISAPKLKILGMLSEDIAELQFGTTTFQKMIAVSLTTKMHTVRVLALYSAGPNLDTVVNFLKCFPCLAKLYVIFQFQSGMGTDNVRKYDPLDPIECLELHLKEVVLKNYNGTKTPSIDFAKFFVLNVKVLKEMKITLPYH